MITKKLDPEKIFKYVHAPGVTCVVDGKRGGGKTHFLVCIMEAAISQGYEVLTNVIFKQKIRGGWREKYPEHIHKITSIAQMYKKAAEILDKDRDTPLLVVFDELQNSAHAYRTLDEMSYTLTVIQGDARKWNMNTIFATPVYEGIPAGIRRYAEFHYFKSRSGVRYYNSQFGTNYNFKQMIFLEGKDIAGALAIIVPVTKYNKPKSQCKTGDIIYDHKSSAILRLGTIGGKDFNLKEFEAVYGDKIAEDIPQAVLDWFEKKEEEAEYEKIGITAVDVARWIYATTGGTVEVKIPGKREKVRVPVTAELLSRLTGAAPTSIRYALNKMTGGIVENEGML